MSSDGFCVTKYLTQLSATKNGAPGAARAARLAPLFGPYQSFRPEEETGPAQILRTASAVAWEIVIFLPSQTTLAPTSRRASQ